MLILQMHKTQGGASMLKNARDHVQDSCEALHEAKNCL